ncbi:hypothetical protein, unlikely [Trypanosoma brucei gambiense DAL972]|uniref:Uncharacterized protein n=1 Tax=Trypanosoma brucei gambiense (strain MHOM/CI/86/DAL972) TaxID=679716 RepID=C9ZJC7_TRYB9|nr:hypothetical protein, unlikely [Trypanosoma brucei gambiense DAL972]CBH09486.1 hypothetical protein, unlikely [Trypanosoma brucei gambiense DAL972]|eukprot:XP_011771791.1 hypothetical protein, unlikely [Trypanosoma brucei gambiense DAL972]
MMQHGKYKVIVTVEAKKERKREGIGEKHHSPTIPATFDSSIYYWGFRWKELCRRHSVHHFNSLQVHLSLLMSLGNGVGEVSLLTSLCLFNCCYWCCTLVC